ncbi:MAG TPA: polyhydroxyalkanoate synthesis repressor PhaR [Hypericibacter adhaerens]|jgi:polyhydroxyalkanoate synthesis repressor PhaR|uniref:Polyhydroxyalkanoate synthesis repressor PhaR n=1 Tax=Hypericibacter adhaerens TaxID=2602016 RepID=A0A5J6N6Y6_9PROT|nr:polyhydroxyalkanoate synthesis repressor PhaR [Hypericibacter adhaerens]QEX24533.1 polyhydroxyalkanoate synthesis repressor PhaR [Hypericibacter adhaerens]HWA42349.1 polyhydroxyalkanoate synthesis repressor PhaR [Hypericibacter adhaerens]
MEEKAEDKSGAKAPITIKKYANRRLYNTATSSYVTLDHLCQMVKDGVEFVVYDAKSGEDITRSVLTQIIVEEESKGGQNLLPLNFLRQLISFYGDNLQFMVPRYLEQSMEAFARNQEQMRRYMQENLGGMFPFGRFEEMSKQNLAFFERAMRMFNPFQAGMPQAGPGNAPRPNEPPPRGPSSANAAPQGEDQIEELRSRLEAIQREISTLVGKPRDEKPSDAKPPKEPEKS